MQGRNSKELRKGRLNQELRTGSLLEALVSLYWLIIHGLENQLDQELDVKIAKLNQVDLTSGLRKWLERQLTQRS